MTEEMFWYLVGNVQECYLIDKYNKEVTVSPNISLVSRLKNFVVEKTL